MGHDEDELQAGPALERRLAELLALLRGEHVPADPDFVSQLLRRARSQRGLRDVLELIGLLARSVPDTLLLMRGNRPSRPDTPE
jgi:hypothetical protein